MKTRILLFLVLILSAGFVQAQKAEVPSELFKDETHQNIAVGLIKQGSEDDKKEFYPKHIVDELKDIAEEIYVAGIAKTHHLEQFECRLKELLKMEEIRAAIGDGDKKDCYKNFINRFGSNCKLDWTFSQIYPIDDSDADKFKKKYKCEGKYETKEFKKNDGTSREKALYQGLYSKALKDFIDNVKNDPQLKVGEYEMASISQCKDGLEKRLFAGYKPQNSCIQSKNECSQHNECCSKYCMRQSASESKGKCAQELSCYRLLQKGQECGLLDNGRLHPYCDTERGQGQCIEVNFNTSEIGECSLQNKKPTAEKPCCSTKVGSDGKCVLKMRCDFCAKGGTVPKNGEKCCPGFYQSLRGICIQDFPPLMLPTSSFNKKEIKESFPLIIAKKILNFLLPNAYAQEQPNTCVAGVNCDNGLDPETQELIDNERRRCFEPDKDGNKPSEDKIQACLKKAKENENRIINEGLSDKNNGWDRDKFLSSYNMSAITSKTGSDFKRCEFNSFNDAWRSASNMERNAEVVLRGFEYVFTGNGTIDFWLDQNGLSMFERAKEVAYKARRYRSDLINQFMEIDRQMACRCIAILGPNKFPEKAEFFNSKCAEEKAELSEELSGADGSSTQSNLSQVEMDQALISETDLGAVGISHQALLMKYLDLRMKAQFERFKANAELEETLNGLADYIIHNKWEQSQDLPEHLYNFTVKRTAGWVAWVVAIVIIIVAIVLVVVTWGGALAVYAVIAAVIIAGAGVAAGFAIDSDRQKKEQMLQEYLQGVAANSIFGEGTNRRIFDETVPHKGKEWYGCKVFLECRDIKRSYIGPFFDTATSTEMKLPSSGASEKRCRIYGSSRVCFRNIHLTAFEEEPRFLLDAKFPEFVSETAYEKDSKFIQKVNEAHDFGIQELKKTKPNKLMKVKWLDEDLLATEEAIKNFSLEQGKWMAKILDVEKQNAFKEGLRKYAKCIDLKACGAKYLSKSDEEYGAYGFGLLFENDTDINHFADYVYQHHFHWPSLSSTNQMAYPTMALSSYFEAILYNMKILGSLARNRGLEYGELYDKYEADWDKRKEDYDCTTPGCANTKMGGTRNVKYSKEFRAAFKRLDLRTGANLDTVAGKNGEILNTQGLSQGELDVLKAGAQMALRAADHQKKLAHYQDTVGNTERGKLKQAAQKSWGENFSAPLNNMPLTVGGQQYGMLRGNDNKKAAKKEETAVASYKPPKYDFKTPNYDYGSSSNYNAPTSSDDKVTKGGLRDSNSDNMYLLESAQKNQEMFKRDDADSIFQIVSKAYYRNLSLILVKQGDKSIEENKAQTKDLDFKSKGSDIDKSKKEELKKLLSQ
jgi:hypothetical protein